jgi:hypothetical protein
VAVAGKLIGNSEYKGSAPSVPNAEVHQHRIAEPIDEHMSRVISGWLGRKGGNWRTAYTYHSHPMFHVYASHLQSSAKEKANIVLIVMGQPRLFPEIAIPNAPKYICGERIVNR